MRAPEPAELALSPRERLRLLPAPEILDQLLSGISPELMLWLGGRHAAQRVEEPWPRVWALRALLYIWSEDHLPGARRPGRPRLAGA